MSKPTFDELRDRIRQSADYHGGAIPHDTALVWDGYLAALLEWGLISVEDHAQLAGMLPEIPDNPVVPLFSSGGRHRDSVLAPEGRPKKARGGAQRNPWYAEMKTE